MNSQDAVKWILSKEGQKALKRAEEQVSKTEAELRRKSVVPYEKLVIPVDI